MFKRLIKKIEGFESERLFLRLWDSPHNGGWVWFGGSNLRRFDFGFLKSSKTVWWALFGFSGSISFATSIFPWCRK